MVSMSLGDQSGRHISNGQPDMSASATDSGMQKSKFDCPSLGQIPFVQIDTGRSQR